GLLPGIGDYLHIRSGLTSNSLRARRIRAGPAIPDSAGTNCYSHSPWASVDWESPVTYWSSTTCTLGGANWQSGLPDYAFFAQLQSGESVCGPKGPLGAASRAWPVRAAQ